MKKQLERLRVFILKRLITEDEKYLMSRAIDERIMKIESRTYRDFDIPDISDMTYSYKALAKIFQSDDWKIVP